MTSRKLLQALAKDLSQAVDETDQHDMLQMAGSMIEADYGLLPEILSLLLAESRKKRPRGALIGAYGTLLTVGLDVTRHRAEQEDAAAIRQCDQLQTQLAREIQSGDISPEILFSILRTLVISRIPLRKDFQDSVAVALGEAAQTRTDMMDDGDPTAQLQAAVEAVHGDPFALHGQMMETLGALPADHRIAMADNLLSSSLETARNAVIGWLLDRDIDVVRQVGQMLRMAGQRGDLSGTSLSRLVLLRPLLADDRRQVLDGIIQTARKAGVAYQPVPKGQILEAWASGFDGSGAHSLFIIVQDGRRRAICSILCKAGRGVRDAWVMPAQTKKDVKELLSSVHEQLGLFAVEKAYPARLLGRFAAMNADSGEALPFPLLDVIERAGLAPLALTRNTVQDRLQMLLDAIPVERKTTEVVAEALDFSADWPRDIECFDSWFIEPEAPATKPARRPSKAKRHAKILERLDGQRLYWADLIVSMAELTHNRDPGFEDSNGWECFALVAAHLLGGGDLSEVGIVDWIVDQSLEVEG